MDTLARRRKGRSPTPAFVLAALAIAGLLALAARELGRRRRRARRRALLSAPSEEPTLHLTERPAVAHPDEGAVEDLRERPRPVGADEAARILGVAPAALASLNIPVTAAADGPAVYDSWEIVHWVEVRHADPAGFEARTGGR